MPAPNHPAPDRQVPPMPLALSNNAVAASTVEGKTRFYSFMGLGAGKTHADISRAAFEYDMANSVWRRLPDVPVSEGRLASVAVAASGAVYLFGGYSVAADGHEISAADVLRFNPSDRTYRKVAPMPVPVDDAVALVRDDRWIYLISGWHQDRNVAWVQVYDTRKNRWRRATDYPGTPVFGHAGAILDDTLLICDGVRLDVIAGKRTFTASPECWRGEIAADAPARIEWRRIEPHPGPARYRMGAAGDTQRGLMFFAGGSENPYNFNGIGYDGKPSPASDRVQAYDPANDRWLDDLTPLPEASMDHRGLLVLGGQLYLIGGMREGQRVSAQTIEYTPELMGIQPPPAP
jgi:N-acetylneuraminic acid mutarotase